MSRPNQNSKWKAHQSNDPIITEVVKPIKFEPISTVPPPDTDDTTVEVESKPQPLKKKKTE